MEELSKNMTQAVFLVLWSEYPDGGAIWVLADNFDDQDRPSEVLVWDKPQEGKLSIKNDILKGAVVVVV